MRFIISLSISILCTALHAVPDYYNVKNLFRSFDNSLPAYGIDSAHQKQSIIHSMALGLYLKAAVILNKKEEAKNAARQLLAMRYSKSKNAPGWGLGFAWDAFSNNKINPTHTIYGITVAICVDALFDFYEYIQEDCYKNAALEALDYYIDAAFYHKNELGFFYYSDSKFDRKYTVHNVTAMLMGQYARAYALTNLIKYQNIADLTANYLLKEKKTFQDTFKWYYSNANNSENDEAHAAFIVQGFINYNKYLNKKINIEPILKYLKLKAHLMPVDNKYLWGAGQMIYTLSDANEKELSEEIILDVLPYFYLGNNKWAWKRTSKQDFLRHRAFILLGLAKYHS